jgi:hypothetical protein
MSYESHKYCNGDLYTGIAKDVKNQELFMNLYACIAMDVKKINYYFQDLYVDIVMDVKNQQIFMTPVCEYCICEMASWKS